MVEDGRLESKSFLKGKDMVYVHSCDFQGWLVKEVYSFVVVIDGIMHYKWVHEGVLHCNGFTNTSMSKDPLWAYCMVRHPHLKHWTPTKELCK